MLKILRSPRFLYLTQRYLVAQCGKILQPCAQAPPGTMAVPMAPDKPMQNKIPPQRLKMYTLTGTTAQPLCQDKPKQSNCMLTWKINIGPQISSQNRQNVQNKIKKLITHHIKNQDNNNMNKKPVH